MDEIRVRQYYLSRPLYWYYSFYDACLPLGYLRAYSTSLARLKAMSLCTACLGSSTCARPRAPRLCICSTYTYTCRLTDWYHAKWNCPFVSCASKCRRARANRGTKAACVRLLAAAILCKIKYSMNVWLRHALALQSLSQCEYTACRARDRPYTICASLLRRWGVCAPSLDLSYGCDLDDTSGKAFSASRLLAWVFVATNPRPIARCAISIGPRVSLRNVLNFAVGHHSQFARTTLPSVSAGSWNMNLSEVIRCLRLCCIDIGVSLLSSQISGVLEASDDTIIEVGSYRADYEPFYIAPISLVASR